MRAVSGAAQSTRLSAARSSDPDGESDITSVTWTTDRADSNGWQASGMTVDVREHPDGGVPMLRTARVRRQRRFGSARATRRQERSAARSSDPGREEGASKSRVTCVASARAVQRRAAGYELRSPARTTRKTDHGRPHKRTSMTH